MKAQKGEETDVPGKRGAGCGEKPRAIRGLGPNT